MKPLTIEEVSKYLPAILDAAAVSNNIEDQYDQGHAMLRIHRAVELGHMTVFVDALPAVRACMMVSVADGLFTPLGTAHVNLMWFDPATPEDERKTLEDEAFDQLHQHAVDEKCDLISGSSWVLLGAEDVGESWLSRDFDLCAKTFIQRIVT